MGADSWQLSLMVVGRSDWYMPWSLLAAVAGDTGTLPGSAEMDAEQS